MPRFSHRPSYPDQPDTHATFRSVVYDGVRVGSVHFEITAHQGDKWSWGAFDANVDGKTRGLADSLEEALERTKAAAIEAMNADPDLLERTREDQRRVAESRRHWRGLRNLPN